MRIKTVTKELGHIWISLSAAYLALLSQFYLVFGSSNRYTLLWSHSYHAAIGAAVISLALIFWLAHKIVSVVAHYFRCPWWADAIVLLWLCFILSRALFALGVQWQGLPDQLSPWLWSPGVKILCYGIIPIPIILLFPTACKRVLRRLYGGLSILLLLFIVASVTWPTYEKYEAALADDVVASKINTGKNILIFIMDEWSYERTFSPPDWRRQLPALAELCDQSTVYSQAYSLGGETRVSIPRLLFSPDQPFMNKSFDDVFAFNERSVPFTGHTLFDLAPTNWLRVAIGFTINYPVILKDKTDLALRFESENVRRTFRGEFRRLLLSQFSFLRLLGIEFDYVVDPDWYPQEEVHDFVMELLAAHPANTLGVFHYGWPHYPYIWTRSGRITTKISAQDAKVHSLSNYQNNLEYMDVAMAEIFLTLNSTGRWQDSLVIFTSDHNWRFDPELPKSWSNLEDPLPTSPWKHVPLIIKYPGQTQPDQESRAVSLAHLQYIIQAYLAGESLSAAEDLLLMETLEPETDRLSRLPEAPFSFPTR